MAKPQSLASETLGRMPTAMTKSSQGSSVPSSSLSARTLPSLPRISFELALSLTSIPFSSKDFFSR